MEIKPRDIVKCNEGKNNKIAFVFSCPGQEELNSEKLVFGQTGRNLDKLLNELEDKFLKKTLNKNTFMEWKKFNGKDKRYFFRITNSHNQVYYKGYLGKNDKRTEPLDSTIKEENNLERLRKELKESEIIICFGNKAKYALNQINKIIEAKVLYTNHLGSRGLNGFVKRKNINITTKGEERTKEILTQIAKELIDQYNQSK